jgi:hypothetical protein
LGNHEFSYTYDASSALEALGLDASDPRIAKILATAKRQALQNSDD